MFTPSRAESAPNVLVGVVWFETSSLRLASAEYEFDIVCEKA